MRQRPSGFEIRHIISHAAKHHIGLHNIVSVHDNTSMDEILLRLGQRKRMDVHLLCRSAIETTFAVEKVVEHPRGGATANNEQQVVLARSPAIPKMLKCRKKTRTWRVEPRQFMCCRFMKQLVENQLFLLSCDDEIFHFCQEIIQPRKQKNIMNGWIITGCLFQTSATCSDNTHLPRFPKNSALRVSLFLHFRTFYQGGGLASPWLDLLRFFHFSI